MEMIFEALYKVVKVMVLMFIAFVIGWYASSRYTLLTMKVWYQPEFDEIMIQDYMGNIEAHYFDDDTPMIVLPRE